MTTIELVIGQQSTAAQTVAEAVADYQQVLQTLGDDLQAQGTGFTGSAAAGFAEAATAWFDVAVTLGPALQKYAEALVLVDTEHGTNEGEVVQDYAKLVGRLGGAG